MISYLEATFYISLSFRPFRTRIFYHISGPSNNRIFSFSLLISEILPFKLPIARQFLLLQGPCEMNPSSMASYALGAGFYEPSEPTRPTAVFWKKQSLAKSQTRTEIAGGCPKGNRDCEALKRLY